MPIGDRKRRVSHRLGAPRRRNFRAGVVLVAAAVGVTALVVTRSEDGPKGGPSTTAVAPAYRAFQADSWWNTPLPGDAPLHPDGEDILDYLRTAPESGRGCLVLAGAAEGMWGQPIYWASPADPEYDVAGVNGDRPPELDSLRIPHGARAADNSDGSMTLYDRDRGYVVALTDARYNEDSDTWRASGATVTYLDSNGLHARTGLSDDPRNRGTHRGNNGATMVVSVQEVRAGAVRHVVKVAAGPETSKRFVFPMVGSDGDYKGDDPAVPPQGVRLRIRPEVDIGEFVRDPEARVIAEGLQRYGFYIGDSGGATALKLENTVAEGRGQLWEVSPDALCGLPFTTEYWDVLEEGYDPSG